MVEKIIVNPNEVRGLGDIMSPKSDTDFIEYASSVTEGTDTVYGATEKVFSLEDTFIFSDGGTSSNYTNLPNNTNMTVTRSSEYTTLTRTSSSSSGFYQTSNLSSPFVVEYDIYLSEDSNHISFRKDTTVLDWITLSEYNLSLNTWHHFKIKIDGTQSTVTTNGIAHQTTTLNNTPNRFVFSINNDTSIKYKNLVIYSI